MAKQWYRVDINDDEGVRTFAITGKGLDGWIKDECLYANLWNGSKVTIASITYDQAKKLPKY